MLLEHVRFYLPRDDASKNTSRWCSCCIWRIFKKQTFWEKLEAHPYIIWNGRVLETNPGQIDVSFNPNDIFRQDVVAFMETVGNCSEQA